MGNNFSVVLGARLRKARESFGLTLQEVAGKLGFNNYQALSSIEDGSRQVKAHELAALSRIYFKDITYPAIYNRYNFFTSSTKTLYL